MKKAQIVFEDFIVGFLMFFVLASTIFFFINSNAGTDIDFFNTSIYQENKISFDYVYLDIYEPESMVLTPSKLVFDELLMNLLVNVSRTGLPSGEYDDRLMDFPVKMSVSWLNCTQYECVQQGEAFMIKNIIKYDRELFNYTFNSSMQKYPDCNSNITIKAELLLDYFTEGYTQNNDYSMPVDFCFFEPSYVRLESLCKANQDSKECITAASDFFMVKVKNLKDSKAYVISASLSNRAGEFSEIAFEKAASVFDDASLLGNDMIQPLNILGDSNNYVIFDLFDGKIGAEQLVLNGNVDAGNCDISITIAPDPQQAIYFNSYLTIAGKIGWCIK